MKVSEIKNVLQQTPLGRDVLKVMAEYEALHGPAGRTWPMFSRHGVVGTISRLVCSRRPSHGFTVLAENGRKDLTFEAVGLRHPAEFDQKVLKCAEQRLKGHATVT